MIISVVPGLALTLGLAGVGRIVYGLASRRAATHARVRHVARAAGLRRKRALVVFDANAPKVAPATWVDSGNPDRVSVFKMGWRALPPLVAGGALIVAGIWYY